jgi:N-methylhydantoinase A
MKKIRLGVDTGGTFTDFVVVEDGQLRMFKALSTPQDPEKAILGGLEKAGIRAAEVIHGSTVATNALLERKGAKTALLTTRGFEDVIVIGRQTRRDLYDIFVTRPDPLVSEEVRFGVRERVLYDGSVETPLDLEDLKGIVRRLREKQVESVAVSLLFSFANPAHENAILDELKALNIPVSLSSQVLPEYREYERTSTTVINAYLAPLMSRYLRRLQTGLSGSPLRVMQSNGGAVQAQTAANAPVRTILSGPAGGVVGAFHIGRMCGYDNLITFDMGGTSTDVALCEGQIKVTHESEVDGMPVGIPMIDIHTVGAGGGSIAHVDAGGALKVGPESAGADPGPICYGNGERLTVTDANVLLGRLLPRFFLGGKMSLAVERIPAAIAKMAWTRTWKRSEELAQGVVDVVNNNMEQAIRLISVERGYDPRDFSLFCFGGAGGLHAVSLAKGLGIPRVIVPQFPGALSAVGLLLADVRKDYSRTLLIDAEGAASRLNRTLNDLHRIGMRELRSEGFSPQQIHIQSFVDLRYRGQSYELSIPLTPRYIAEFHTTHERRYGYANADKAVELVNVRAAFLGRTEKPQFRKSARARGKATPVDSCMTWVDGKKMRTSVYERTSLGFGHTFRGPAIIGEYSSTTLVPPGSRCTVDAWLNLVIE